MLDRRRYIVSEIYDHFMVLKVKGPTGEFKPAKLLNVSLSGIRLKGEFALSIGSSIECLISTPKTPIKEISCSAKITHCVESEQGKAYIMGAEILYTSAESWVNKFFKLHDFINENLRTFRSDFPCTVQEHS